MKQAKLISIFLLGFSFLNLEFASTVQAQVVSISAIPPRLEVTLLPGKVKTVDIKVRNDSSTEKNISTTSRDFIVTDDRGTPVQLESNNATQNRWAASTWIQISPTKLALKPGETKTLTVTILVPADALPGGHYAMILHTPTNLSTISQTGASIEANVGTLVYITVPGNIKQDAVVSDFSAPSFKEYGPVDFTTTVANFSDIHITPAGSITVKNWLGGVTADLPLTSTNIFPYTSRNFTNQLSHKWLFGRYTATLNAAYGTAGGVLVASLIFWVIPWRFILLLVVALLLVGVIIYLIKTRSQSPQQVENQVEELEKELTELKKKYRDRK